jgi:2-phosphosulfolactate phosphatase
MRRRETGAARSASTHHRSLESLNDAQEVKEKTMRKTVKIDCFPESVPSYRNGYAIVAVDVIRATTTAVTAVALGRRVYPVPSLEVAVPLAAKLPDPLLVGELGGSMPYGFDLNNSPADVEIRSDVHRPMILLTTSGTRVICGAESWQAMYVACLRNYNAQVTCLANHHPSVVVIGAGSRGEFREEDQLGCAWIAEGLLRLGYEPEDAKTMSIVERWSDVPVTSITTSASADYLRKSGQTRDLDFVLSHVDDLDDVYRYERGQIVKVTADLPLQLARA